MKKGWFKISRSKDLCVVKLGKRYCRNPGDLIYYSKLICNAHYGLHCDGKIDLKQALSIVPKIALNRGPSTAHKTVGVGVCLMKKDSNEVQKQLIY
ncbi:hypothetical protein LCGC14_1065220 [marine sediment metagenome]|uniref:Uncharacterized protein n=1 Tax=marine sediment metagenome TaxID=412755 RepID=A0A0F9MJV9_9ZZZZ